MRGVLHRVRDLLRLFFTGHAQRVWHAVRERLYSNGGAPRAGGGLSVAVPAPGRERPRPVRPPPPRGEPPFFSVGPPGRAARPVFPRGGPPRDTPSRPRAA